MLKKIIIGITGASGVIYGVRIIKLLQKQNNIETHLIISDSAKQIIGIETKYKIDEIKALSDCSYDNNQLDSKISSGSFLTYGMIIIPCTIKTLSAIANSYTEKLIVRAADVTLKEKRKLVLGVRETPFHKGHLNLMLKAAEMGACILPPIPSFYNLPKTIDDIIDQTIGKIFDYFEIKHNLFKRWEGEY